MGVATADGRGQARLRQCHRGQPLPDAPPRQPDGPRPGDREDRLALADAGMARLVAQRVCGFTDDRRPHARRRRARRNASTASRWSDGSRSPGSSHVAFQVGDPGSRGSIAMVGCAVRLHPTTCEESHGDSTQGPRSGRRDFLKTGGATTAALLASPALASTPRDMPGLPSNPRTPAAMPTRNLGKTGYKVGIFSLGGQARARASRQLRRCRPAHRARARPGRQLRRHLLDLRRPRALERAVRREGHGSSPQGRVPGDEDEGA